MHPQSKINPENGIKLEEQKLTAINTRAIPVGTYSSNVIDWNLSERKKIDTKIGKQLRCNRMHHSKSDVDHLYVPRSKGGRGKMQFQLSYKASTIGLLEYLDLTNDWMLQLVRVHETLKGHPR